MFDFERFAKAVDEKAPLREGWTPNDEQTSQKLVDIQPATHFDIVNAPSIAFLQKQFAFFNHGTLVKFSPTPGDPVRRFCTFNKLSGPVFTLRSSFPLFKGLGEPWDSMLVGCPLKDWEQLQRYLDTDTALVREQGLFLRPLAQTQFPIPDFLLLQRLGSIPDFNYTVVVDMYGIDSNKRCIHFKPATDAPRNAAKVIFDIPEDETVLIGQQVLMGKENPFEF